jgi:hypothetical protein
MGELPSTVMPLRFRRSCGRAPLIKREPFKSENRYQIYACLRSQDEVGNEYHRDSRVVGHGDETVAEVPLVANVG